LQECEVKHEEVVKNLEELLSKEKASNQEWAVKYEEEKQAHEQTNGQLFKMTKEHEQT